jgi:hypothetical protein
MRLWFCINVIHKVCIVSLYFRSWNITKVQEPLLRTHGFKLWQNLLLGAPWMHGSRLLVICLIGIRNRNLQAWCSEDYPYLLRQSFCMETYHFIWIKFPRRYKGIRNNVELLFQLKICIRTLETAEFPITDSFLGSHWSFSCTRISKYFMESEGPIPCSQEPAIGPYHKTD